MNCIISSEEFDISKLKILLESVPSMAGLELASVVSTKENYVLGNPESKIRVAVLDYGIKQNILNCFLERGAYVKVFNAKTTFEELEEFKPNGYFISNGPGDPEPMDYAVKTIKQILQEKNLFLEFASGNNYLHLPMIYLLLKCIMGTGD